MLVAIVEPTNKQILLHIDMSFERTMLVAKRLIVDSLINKYGKHPISTDGGICWPPHQASKFLKVDHYIHSSLEKSIIIERRCNT